MPSPSTRRPVIAGSACAALLAVLVGCGGGSGDPGAGDATRASTGATSPTTASSSTADSSSSSPVVAAATGPVLTQPSLTIHLPAGWQPTDNHRGDITVGGGDSDGHAELYVTEVAIPPSLDLDAMVRIYRDGGLHAPGPVRRAADVQVGGRTMFHLVSERGTRRDEHFGINVDGRAVFVIFNFYDEGVATHQQVVDAALASVRWRR